MTKKRDCISNLRVADDVLMMATSVKQLKRMITDFKKNCRSARARNLPRQIENSEHPETNKLKEIEIDGMHVEILLPEGKSKNDHIDGPGNHRGATQNPMRMVRIRQISTRTDVWCRNMDYYKKNTKKCFALPGAECFVSSFR